MAETARRERIHVGPPDILEGRTIVPVTAGALQLILIRSENGIVAAERACPHEGADLALGRCSDGRLLCPRHLAWFDLRSGIAPGWLCRALRLYPVAQEPDGLWVEI